MSGEGAHLHPSSLYSHLLFSVHACVVGAQLARKPLRLGGLLPRAWEERVVRHLMRRFPTMHSKMRHKR